MNQQFASHQLRRGSLRRLQLPVALACAFLFAPLMTHAQEYVQTNLVTDLSTGATVTKDVNLKNPWGLTRSTSSPWWVSDNNAGVATVYDGAGSERLIVVIPGPNGTTPCPVGGPVTSECFVSTPTGMVFNGTSSFAVTPGKPASFIFDTEDGTISAWAGGSAATLKVDNSANPTADEGAVYKGLTIGDCNGTPYLYATNFRAGRVEVYDTNFKQVHLSGKCEVDNDIWKHDDRGHEDSFDDERMKTALTTSAFRKALPHSIFRTSEIASSSLMPSRTRRSTTTWQGRDSASSTSTARQASC